MTRKPGKIDSIDLEKSLFSDAQQKIRRGRDRLKRIETLLKEIEKSAADPESGAFIMREKLTGLVRISKDLEQLSELPPILGDLSSALSSIADKAFGRAKTAMATGLAAELGAKGFDLSGNFPQLSCGLLTLEFTFESGGKVNIYFGPRIEKLKQVPMHIETIADAIFSIYKSLDGPGFGDEEHLGLVFKAYNNTLQLLGEDMGTAIPISDVLLQTAILKQGKRFLVDPVKSRFSSYGRVQFAYDLSRTKIRSIADHELHLTVASMEQTRKPESHLWVPRGPRSLKGTHFSSLSFRQVS